MEKRYQVFVSSTFEDLQEERRHVMQSLLLVDCIPAGMELFPAGNDDQWSLIKSVIDDCDYYIVIVGGRYGTPGPEGISYTEMEYRYALASGKPVMAFLHKDPGSIPASRTESSTEGRERLAAFRQLISQKMCRFWTTPGDLGSQVTGSLIKLIKMHPTPGWIRATNELEQAAQQLVRLQARIDELERELRRATPVAPPDAGMFAQEDDPFTLRYSVRLKWTNDYRLYDREATFDWNTILRSLGTHMLSDVPERVLRDALNEYLAHHYMGGEYTNEVLRAEMEIERVTVHADDFHQIKYQLKTLGLITTTDQRDETGRPFWSLTPYGDAKLSRMLAIRRRGF